MIEILHLIGIIGVFLLLVLFTAIVLGAGEDD